jgi:hypothetical protein
VCWRMRPRRAAERRRKSWKQKSRVVTRDERSEERNGGDAGAREIRCGEVREEGEGDVICAGVLMTGDEVMVRVWT